MAARGMSKLHVRESNQMQILMLLKTRGPMSRVDLARHLSLTKAGVSVLVSEMLDKGYLTETGECVEQEQSKPGKKKIALDINADYGYTVGCTADVAFIHAGAADVKGHVLFERDAMPTSCCATAEALCCELLEAVQEALEHIPPGKRLLGVGVGINRDLEEALSCRRDLLRQVETYFRAHLSCPVLVESSTRALATAQLDYSADTALENLLFVEVSDAVNVAFILNGEPYLGARGNAGNMAHVVVDPNGPLCSCGRRGCINALVSVKYVLQKISGMLTKENFPILYDLVNGNPNQLNYDALVLAADLGDPKAKEVYDTAEALFGQLLLNLVNIFDPERCYIHGMGIYAEGYIRGLNAMAEQTMDARYRDVFSLSALNRNHEFLAGCAIAGRRYFYQRAEFEEESNKRPT